MTEFKIRKTKSIKENLRKRMYNVNDEKTINITCGELYCNSCRFSSLIGFKCNCDIFHEEIYWRHDFEGDTERCRCDSCLDYEDNLNSKKQKKEKK